MSALTLPLCLMANSSGLHEPLSIPSQSRGGGFEQQAIPAPVLWEERPYAVTIRHDLTKRIIDMAHLRFAFLKTPFAHFNYRLSGSDDFPVGPETPTEAVLDQIQVPYWKQRVKKHLAVDLAQQVIKFALKQWTILGLTYEDYKVISEHWRGEGKISSLGGPNMEVASEWYSAKFSPPNTLIIKATPDYDPYRAIMTFVQKLIKMETEEDLLKALELLNSSLKERDDIRLRTKRVQVLLDLGHNSEALDQARRDREQFPDNVVARILLAASLLKTGDIQESIRVARESVAMQGSSDFPNTRIVLAQSLYEGGFADEALSVIRQAVIDFPDRKDVRTAVPSLIDQIGDKREIKASDVITEVELLLLQGDYLAAVKILETNPLLANHPYGITKLPEILFELGNHAAARQKAREAIKRFPQVLALRILLAETLLFEAEGIIRSANRHFLSGTPADQAALKDLSLKLGISA